MLPRDNSLSPPLVSRPTWATLCVAAILGSMSVGTGQAADLRFVIRGENNKPMPCRIHLFDKDNQPQRAGQLPFFRNHFTCPGDVSLRLPDGMYRYEIERGHEFRRVAGSVTIGGNSPKTVEVQLQRIANMAAEGWYSGDLHVHRPVEDMKLLMRAEDLHVAPVITWWNARNLWANRPTPDNPLVRFDGNRYYQIMAGEDEREGGALMYFGRKTPLAIAGSQREWPSPMKFVEEARHDDQPCWIDAEKPFWWDVPVWIASGQIDSIGLANNHMCRAGMLPNEAWGRPRDVDRLPPPRGNGFWTQEIYYHLLNCGLRIPPSAGSASGVLPNPVGYNRVYVHVGQRMEHAAWWRGLKAGRSFVTNGPLLRCEANGQLPGHVFSAKAGEEVAIDLTAKLITQDNIPAIEIVRNGQVERTVTPEDLAKNGSLGQITFKRSGWFLIRAIADNKQTFRFASTAPFYVEIGPSKQHISRRSVQFFLDWIDERIDRVEKALQDPTQRKDVLDHHHRARQYWKNLADRANAQ